MYNFAKKSVIYFLLLFFWTVQKCSVKSEELEEVKKFQDFILKK